MKKENQIAKENIKLEKTGTIASNYKSKEHKQSCERFLEFFKDTFGEEIEETEEFDMVIKKKMTDLRDAIKSYEGDKI